MLLFIQTDLDQFPLDLELEDDLVVLLNKCREQCPIKLVHALFRDGQRIQDVQELAEGDRLQFCPDLPEGVILATEGEQWSGRINWELLFLGLAVNFEIVNYAEGLIDTNHLNPPGGFFQSYQPDPECHPNPEYDSDASEGNMLKDFRARDIEFNDDPCSPESFNTQPHPVVWKGRCCRDLENGYPNGPEQDDICRRGHECPFDVFDEPLREEEWSPCQVELKLLDDYASPLPDWFGVYVGDHDYRVHPKQPCSNYCNTFALVYTWKGPGTNDVIRVVYRPGWDLSAIGIEIDGKYYYSGSMYEYNVFSSRRNFNCDGHGFNPEAEMKSLSRNMTAGQVWYLLRDEARSCFAKLYPGRPGE